MKLYAVGDLVLDEPNADFFFDLARDALSGADILCGHVEVPHTTRGVESVGDVPAPASAPENLKALKNARFHLATLAGNHVHDRGAQGIADTIATLRENGVVTVGAGEDIDAARAPAIVTRGATKIGFLSYNCVGPREGWASATRAGCAYINVLTHYELNYAGPGGPPKIYTFCEPDTVEAMQADIEGLKQRVDAVVVAFHKGLVHTPAALAMYERPLCKAAIEAGADLVLGHHPHILKGVEIYRGKAIFHGLGNFVTVTRALTAKGNDHAARRAWAERRKQLFGFEPDPDYPLYPFHPEAKNAIIASCTWNGAAFEPGFLPCWIEPTGQPRVLTRSKEGEAVKDYVAKITSDAGMKASFDWDGDRVAIS